MQYSNERICRLVNLDREELGKIQKEIDNKIKQEHWDDEIETGSTEGIESNIAQEGTLAPQEKSSIGQPTAPTGSKVTPSGQIRPELLPPQQTELFQEKSEFF